MVKEKIEHPWYSFDKILSYNAVINMILGGRGIGKTYGALKMVFRKYLKTGEQFIYMRRHHKEMGKAKAGFLTAISAEFPDYDMRVNGDTIELAHITTREDKKRSWQVAGFFVELSTAQSIKGVDFSNVHTIIYDEFIAERGRQYLPEEAYAFLNFYNTVDRWQDRARVLLLANAVSIENPYFIAWNISPDMVDMNNITIMNSGYIAVHFPDNDEFKASIYKTRFGRFIEGTEFAEYAVENKFSDNEKTLVEKKDPRAHYVYSLKTRSGNFSVWHNMFTGEYYAQEKQPRNGLVWYTMDMERISRECKYLEFTSPKARVLRKVFKEGRMTFDNPHTRNSFMRVFKR